jgi:hypothetical protein
MKSKIDALAASLDIIVRETSLRTRCPDGRRGA